jgi:hypothetical protein
MVEFASQEESHGAPKVPRFQTFVAIANQRIVRDRLQIRPNPLSLICNRAGRHPVQNDLFVYGTHCH